MQPKNTAYQAMVQTTASAPAFGQPINTTPKAIEISPLRMSYHALSMTFRSWMAAKSCNAPMMIAHAAINISSTSAVIPV
jgi:hypothetical protein